MRAISSLQSSRSLSHLLMSSCTVNHAVKMISTSGFLTDLDCTEFVFGQASAPDPAGGAYYTPNFLAGGPTYKGNGRERKGRKGRGSDPFGIFLDPPLSHKHAWRVHPKNTTWAC